MSPSQRRSGPPQRWPDIMIGVLTLALLGGFGALLLAPHKPAEVTAVTPPASNAIPASPGTVPAPQPVTPPPAQPVTPASDTTDGTKATDSGATTSGTAASGTAASGTAAAGRNTDTASNSAPTSTPAPATGRTDTTASESNATTTKTPETSATGTTSTSASTSASTSEGGEVTQAPTTTIPPVPVAPPVKPITPPVLPKPKPAPTATATPKPTSTATPTPATAPVKTTPKPDASTDMASTTPAIPATPAVAPRRGGAVATSAARTPLRSDYRITLGSFSTRKTVTSQTASVSALGYTVYPIDLGDQYVAQVGPFADEASARQALADIQRAYPGALLYRPKAKASESTATTSDSSSSAASSDNTASSSSSSRSSDTSSQTNTSQASSTQASSGPTYLQVGAFDREESAQRLVGILRDNGFAPTVSSPANHKTTVMVGPYSGAALERAETRLNNAGLDHFRLH